MISLFDKQWDEVPLIVFDSETTGVRWGAHAVSVGGARFESGQFVGGFNQLVHCPIPIPEDATAIHGITNGIGRPDIEEVLQAHRTLIEGAQPAAYNAGFDRRFIPNDGYPWLDGLVIVRHIDKWIPGVGRHRLTTACARYGIELVEAHSAGADARACGELIYKLGRAFFPKEYSMGQVLYWCARAEAKQQFELSTWRAGLWRFRKQSKEWYGRSERGRSLETVHKYPV